MARYVLRYGSMRMLGLFSAGKHDRFVRGDLVVARTNRGLEAAEVLSEADDAAAERLADAPRGQVMRLASDDDRGQLAHLAASDADVFERCARHIAESGLEMRLVDVEQMLGGERIIVYYLAEERIDFRELVKRLAEEFRVRIEMRHIGVRDEAKLLADYGDCGKPVCCNTHLSSIPPVSMKMAKLQKSTLDPNKISGRCGRLKCCLRYEYDVYVELQRELPPIGCDVVTDRGRARVLGHEILAGQLLVELEDHRRVLIESSEVLTVINKKKRRQEPKQS